MTPQISWQIGRLYCRLQASCVFADMANNTADLTLDGAETVVSFLSAHIAGLQDEAAFATLAPLPNGDPFK